MYFQLYFSTFSGHSVCGLPLCKQLFKLFRKEYMQASYTLQVPPPESMINKNIDKHVNPGETPEEQQARKNKSTFLPPYNDPQVLHQCIKQAIEPVRSGTEKLATFLIHSINIETQQDSWAFIFHHTGHQQFNQNNPGLGKILLPRGRNYYQQEILIIFWVHKFISMYPSGMLFEDNGQTPAGLLIPTWKETVLQKRHKSAEYPDTWYDTWDDWCCTQGEKLQKCTALWYISKNNQQKDFQSGRKEWIECLNLLTRFRQQFEEESDEEEESSGKEEEEELGSEGTGESEEEEEETSEEEVSSEGTGGSEEEEEEVGSEGTAESEGFSSRGEGSSCESVRSDTHTSEYSETSAGDISCTEHKREETEINKHTTDRAEESQTGIFPNKRKGGEGTVDSYSSKCLKGNTDFTSEGET